MSKIVWLVLLVIALASIAGFVFWPRAANTVDSVGHKNSEVDVPNATTVHLSERQLAGSSIRSEPVTSIKMKPSITVSGHLDYDQDRHIAIKAAFDGVVAELLVQPGESVVVGQPVAKVSGPAIGAAGADARTRLLQRNLADTKRKQDAAICEGVEAMAELIKQQATPEKIEQELSGKSLASYREKLISAYTRSRLARQIADSSRQAASTGALPGRVQQQRESELQAAEAALNAMLEQTLLETRRLCRESTAELDNARRQFEVSLNQLRTIMGPAARPINEEDINSDSSDNLSSVVLVSPLAGTIEERVIAANERVAAGDTIYVIADTSHLWAVADIRQHDWLAISIKPGELVTVTSPALGNQCFDAHVKFVGRRVDTISGAAPITVTLESNDSRLRPGLFAYIAIPTGPSRSIIAVPEKAALIHEGKSFVFIDDGEGSFHRQDVTLGVIEHGNVEVLTGLADGDRVVVDGAFTLKSELLLVSEGE